MLGSEIENPGVLETFLISKHVRPSLSVQATHPAWWCTYVVALQFLGALLGRKGSEIRVPQVLQSSLSVLTPKAIR